MSVDPRIQELRDKIPDMKCIRGCIRCCGIPSFTKVEWDAVEDKRKATSPRCPYASTKEGCAIHENRPIMCRLVGTFPGDERLACPLGEVSDKTLSVEEVVDILSKYKDIALENGAELVRLTDA